MTDLERPYPQPDAVTQVFWDGIAEGRLRLQHCRDCHRYVFYPRAVCPYCMGAELEWTDTSGRGSVYSYTVVHLAAPGFDGTPYVIALVDLVEGVRMMTRLVGVEPGEVEIGLRVHVAILGKPPLPCFGPADAGPDPGSS